MILVGKISQFCSKSIMKTPIHVLCSNFTEISRQKVVETMRCSGDKNFVFLAAILRPFGGRRQKFAKERAT